MDVENACSICYETFAKDLEEGGMMNVRLEVEGCDHAFCRECLAVHCKVAISSREIPIRCPASVSEYCTNLVKEEQVKTLVCSCRHEKESDDALSKYGSIGETDSTRKVGSTSALSHLPPLVPLGVGADSSIPLLDSSSTPPQKKIRNVGSFLSKVIYDQLLLRRQCK